LALPIARRWAPGWGYGPDCRDGHGPALDWDPSDPFIQRLDGPEQAPGTVARV